MHYYPLNINQLLPIGKIHFPDVQGTLLESSKWLPAAVLKTSVLAGKCVDQ
jgi:hypothetical protein